MTATILSFGRRKPNEVPLPAKTPWQNQDLAELYRVRDRLAAAGLDVEVEAGVSDEGDPWFVYCQAGTDNVVVHIARIDSEIHVVNCVTNHTYVGTSFRDVSDRMLEDGPMALGAPARRSANVVLHPSAFLTAFVAAAIMLIDMMEHGRAQAAPADGAAAPHDGDGGGVFVVSEGAEAQIGGEDGEAVPADADRGATEGAEPADAAGLHRRVAKDGPATIQTASVAVSGTSGPPLPAAALAAPAHLGFLADLPGSGASITLAAGILAAELARTFVGDAEHLRAGTAHGPEFVQALTSLLSSFVGVEAAHARTVAALDTASGGIAPLLATGSLLAGPALGEAAHAPITVVAAALAEINAAVNVRSAPDGWTEQAVFAAPAPSGATASPASVVFLPTSAPAAPPSGSGQSSFEAVAAAAPALSADAPPAASGVVVAAPQLTHGPATAAKVEPAKDLSTDIGSIVSRLVRHGADKDDAVTGGGKSDGMSGADHPSLKDLLTKDGLPGKPGDDAGDADKGGGAKDTPTGGGGAVPVDPLDKPSAGKTPVGTDPADRPDPKVESVLVTPEFGRAVLTAGRHETVHYEAGTSLRVEGFVLGEDFLFFDEGVGDRMASKARADGYDLVLGDDAGSVRLVGVLAEADLMPRHADGQAAAA